jgi:hypothetical protein
LIIWPVGSAISSTVFANCFWYASDRTGIHSGRRQILWWSLQWLQYLVQCGLLSWDSIFLEINRISRKSRKYQNSSLRIVLASWDLCPSVLDEKIFGDRGMTWWSLLSRKYLWILSTQMEIWKPCIASLLACHVIHARRSTRSCENTLPKFRDWFSCNEAERGYQLSC